MKLCLYENKQNELYCLCHAGTSHVCQVTGSCYSVGISLQIADSCYQLIWIATSLQAGTGQCCPWDFQHLGRVAGTSGSPGLQSPAEPLRSGAGMESGGILLLLPPLVPRVRQARRMFTVHCVWRAHTCWELLGLIVMWRCCRSMS